MWAQQGSGQEKTKGKGKEKRRRRVLQALAMWAASEWLKKASAGRRK